MPTGAPTAAELATFVSDYYAAMPGGTDQGWDQLSRRYQRDIARNQPSYEGFWSTIDALEVDNVRAATPGRVEATLTYYLKNGRVSVERTVFSVVREDGRLKFDDSDVVG